MTLGEQMKAVVDLMREPTDDDILFEAINDAIDSLWESMVTVTLSDLLDGPVTASFAAAGDSADVVSIANPTGAPVCTSVIQSDLAQHLVEVAYTIVTESGTETEESPVVKYTVPINQLLRVISPAYVPGAIGWNAYVGRRGFTEVFLSPDIDSHEGYTTDGTYHYTTDIATIYKRNDDATWSIAVTNATPFAGLPAGVNHLADLAYYNGRLYIPVQRYVACGNEDTRCIAVFNANDLSLITFADESAQGVDIGGLAVDGPNNIIYTVSFCNGIKIWKYNMTTLAFIGSITLSTTIPQGQGIVLHDGKFYISSDNGNIYEVLADGTVVGIIYTNPTAGAGDAEEGLDYSQGMLRWLVDDGANEKVHYLTPLDSRRIRQNDAPLKFGTDFTEPDVGIDQAPEGVVSPTRNTTGDNIWMIKSIEVLSGNVRTFWEETDIGSQLWRRYSQYAASTSALESYAFDLINNTRIQIRPAAGAALSPSYFYVTKPRRVRFKDATIPFSNPGISEFIKCYAISLIKLSLEEPESSIAWQNRAEIKRMTILKSINVKNKNKNTTIRPFIRG